MNSDVEPTSIPQRVEALEKQVRLLMDTQPILVSSIELMRYHDQSGDEYRVELRDAYGQLTQENSICALAYIEGPLNHRDAHVGCFLTDNKWMFAVRNIGGIRIAARVVKLRFKR